MEDKEPMSSPAIALEAKQRCSGCHSHAERKLVVDMGRACETVSDAYAIEPHPAIASLKAEIVQISKRVNKAAGIE
jgi:hypothetical protein